MDIGFERSHDGVSPRLGLHLPDAILLAGDGDLLARIAMCAAARFALLAFDHCLLRLVMHPQTCDRAVMKTPRDARAADG